MVKVTVIIPTYNRQAMLARAVESVRNQTFGDWELIVVDDGSTDQTEEMARAWADVTFIKSDNRGVSHARNLGARHAKGEWLAFLDSDDEWLPGKLEAQLHLTENFQIIHGEEVWRRNGQEVLQKKKHAKSGGRIFSRAAEICFVAPSSVLINRDLFLSSKGFREDFPVCEDYEYWLRLSSKHEFGYVSEPVLIRHGGHGDQLSMKFKAMDYYRVKALVPFLENEDLSAEERAGVATQLLCKAEVLLKGYQKYPNETAALEVQAFADLARNCLTQNQSAHSAAARLPRSMESLT